ncbi:hypothetical protein H310_14392 [Aphanomyces invadans]|uniref:Pseudouridine synthase RsuA/RluA-like domain-containing protein n=1 Tax=Aphanomyces invadans TaxID=157072 RepID=A0A024T9W2_9STRA|nr:hypothetical protein H310_14392 [Aphanomyces invadans]ETV90905.1 hypothetical protein H310_14392 [Aphanomyces invadans]|eukprot:XP_008880470.1 hypothetical protein H310_14392 [Aphanomyces invadans]
MARKRHRLDGNGDDRRGLDVVRHAVQCAVEAISEKCAVDLTALTFRVRPHSTPGLALQDTTAYSSDIPLRLYHSKLLDLSDIKATSSLLLDQVKAHLAAATLDATTAPDTIAHVDETDSSSRLVFYTRHEPRLTMDVLDVTLPLQILHEDNAVIVVVKPHDLPSVDGRDRDTSLHRILQSKYPNVRMVHRLDMETSGVMVAALTYPSAQHLNAQFRAKSVSKTYTAVVEGHLSTETCVVTHPLAADPTHRVKQIVDNVSGKPCETQCKVVRHLDNGDTRVHLTPVTGRTHQLRVHMQSLGHPIVGDSLYAARPASTPPARLCLHATTLEFRHPTTRANMTFHSEPPF